jgi:hypothetical protein
VEVTGVTYTIWVSPCLPDGAKIRHGDAWRPAETWGPGWESPPVDNGKPLGSGGKKKKARKKKRVNNRRPKERRLRR